ncbi:MAG: phosphotransferase [Candidatus Promineifilaceae bacterium]
MMDILVYLVQEGLLPATTEYTLSPLTGGFWNDVYRLQGNGRDWVVKYFRAANPGGLYPILPQAEALALKTLRDLAIAPEPIAFLPDGPLLVYEFFEGDVWREDAAGIGRLLRHLHDVAISPEGGFRQLPITPDAILQQGDYLLVQAAPDALTAQLRSRRPRPQPQPPLPRLSLVHTDTWAGNFVQNGRHLRLIDWQCPGLGSPAEDVWTFLHSGYEMLLGRSRFEEHIEREFWAGYGESAVFQQATLLSPFYTYRTAAHCCLRQQQLTSTDPTGSENYRKIATWLISKLK